MMAAFGFGGDPCYLPTKRYSERALASVFRVGNCSRNRAHRRMYPHSCSRIYRLSVYEAFPQAPVQARSLPTAHALTAVAGCRRPIRGPDQDAAKTS